MKTLPVEFRRRVIVQTDEGSTSSEIAEALGVSAAWVRSIKKLHDSGQPLEPKSRANKRRSLAQREGDRIRAQVAAKPGTTLEDLKRDLKLSASISTLWNALQELKLRLNPCRRAESARCRRRPRRLERPRGRDRSPPPRFLGRNLRQHHEDPPLRVGADGPTGARLRAPRALENHHLRRRLPARRTVRADGR